MMSIEWIYFYIYIRRKGTFNLDPSGISTESSDLSPAQTQIRHQFMGRLAAKIQKPSEGIIRFPDEGFKLNRIKYCSHANTNKYFSPIGRNLKMMSKFQDKPPWKVEAKVLAGDRSGLEAIFRLEELQYMTLKLENNEILPFAIDIKLDGESRNLVNNNLNKHKCNNIFIQGREQMKVWKVMWPRNYEFANKDHMCLITDISKRINPEP